METKHVKLWEQFSEGEEIERPIKDSNVIDSFQKSPEKSMYIIILRNENPGKESFNEMKGYIITGTSDDAHRKATELTNPGDTPEYDPDEPNAWLGTTSVIRLRDGFTGSDGPILGEQLYQLLGTECADQEEVVFGILNTIG